MSWRKGGGNGGMSDSPVGKGKGVPVVSNQGVNANQLNQAVSDMNLGSDNGWGVFGRKSKNKGVNQGAPQNPPPPKAWGHPNVVEKLGMRPPGRFQPPPPPVAPDTPPMSEDDEDDDFEDDDDFDDDDDEDNMSDSDWAKKNKWLAAFFEKLDGLTNEEVSEPGRQWHCPACHGGPGAIDWYCGVQPLIAHAKTKGSKRVKLHREFAKLFSQELAKRGTNLNNAGEAFGKWKGLLNDLKDKDIVWPPMVIVMNTLLEQDENDKWIGMGNQELLDYFESYSASRARHSYGPKGHRGMSVLIFEASAIGYLEAERLSKHFEVEGTHREAWDKKRVMFYPGGQRQLYGFMAEKSDMDVFNQHCQGKSKLKFEIRSYQEEVVSQLKQMGEDNQQLNLFKDKVRKEKNYSKTLEQFYTIATEKLRRVSEENRIVRQKTKTHHQETKEMMDSQEQFFEDQIKTLQETRDRMDNEFEKLQQEECEKIEQSLSNSSSKEDLRTREEKMAKFIGLQNKRMDEFVEKRDKLMESYKEKKAELKQKEIELEKEIEYELNQLMQLYKPLSS
jgi:hypothetical protein